MPSTYARSRRRAVCSEDRAELNVSRPPAEADALLLRIRTMKWQAVTILASSTDGLAREDAAALIATLDGIVASVSSNPAPDIIKAARLRIEHIAILRDHEPRRRTAGA
jgi:hypothetical protein